MTDINRLITSLKRRSSHVKEFGDDITFVKLEDLDALVEALEKAQRVDEELCKLLPPGVEYMDPPDGGDVTPLEGVRRMVADYRQRIAGLEESHAQVIQSRDHYKRMLEEGLEQLAEPRTVTVKLPQAVSAGGQGYQEQVERILTAAGIKWEAE
ncbi:TPA: hypothetical protein ACF3I9_000862 [Klebsiella aerogenes]